MKKWCLEGLFGKLRLGLFVMLFIFGLFSIVGTGGGGGTTSESGGTSGGDTTAATMEEDIQNKTDAVFSIVTSEGVNEGVDALSSLLEDENIESVVTITPDTFDLQNLPDTITLSLDFGAGYTTEDGNLFTGSGTVAISNIQFSDTVIGAQFTATFNNITVNGQTYLTGTVSGGISLTQPAQGDMAISGSIQFQGFQWNGQSFSGSVTLSGTIQGVDLENPSGTITVTFNQLTFGENSISGSVSLILGGGAALDAFTVSFSNFTMNGFTISSGTVAVSLADEDQYAIDMNLTTSEGPMDIVVDVTLGETEIVFDTETAGTMGPYTVSMDNLTFPYDWETVPASGTMTLTETSTGKTATLTFNKTLASDPPYDYSETP